MEELARMAATRRAVVRPRGGQALSRRARREIVSFHLFTAPWLLGFVFLSIIPLLLGLATSFTDYNGLNLPTLRFVGAENYQRALTSPDFWISLGNSAKYAILAVPVGLTLSLLLAVLLNQPIPGRDLFRVLYYIPSILPIAGAARAWSLMFNQNAGLVNAVLSIFRPGTAIHWVNEYFIPLLYLYSWWQIGGGMVLFLAGLQGIPTELYEAAQLDGSGRVSTFRRITLPLVSPVIFFQLIMGILGALQILDVALLVYGRAGLSGQVNLPRDKFMYMIYIYSQVFDFQRFGYGVALSWIFFVLVLILTLIVITTSKYWVYYEVAQEGGSQ